MPYGRHAAVLAPPSEPRNPAAAMMFLNQFDILSATAQTTSNNPATINISQFISSFLCEILQAKHRAWSALSSRGAASQADVRGISLAGSP